MIKEKLALVPNSPGCYLMKNKDGVIIYVGKAKKLKNRLSSYFRGKHSGKTGKLVSEIVDFEYIVVGSETESFILEINLIKKHDPKYNILLRDDKSYPYIEFTNEDVPRLNVIRNLHKKKNNRARLYGPYPNVSAARNTVNLIHRMYPLRKCSNYNKKPCLYYHIGQCLGYCNFQVEQEKIRQMEEEITRFLKGDCEGIKKKIEEEMFKESELLHFEKAKELKELLDYIDITLTKQKVELEDTIDRDIFGYFENKGYLSIQVLFIRGGKIVERHSKILPMIEDSENELSRYIVSFYQKDVLLPKEILVPNIVDSLTLEKVLGISVKTPIKGVKKNLIDMACENAQIVLDNEFELIQKDEARTIEANEELRNKLGLAKLDRIEIFDNSNIFGKFNVSGMVVFDNGKPNKNEYRKFKISIDKNDDYGTMREVIYRRYFRILKDDLRKPDLIIVDGGLGQIRIAYEVISSLGLTIPVIGLKKNDKHHTESLITSSEIEIPIDHKSNLFYLLERMQDEVHRFTINYHKELRSKGALESVLDNIPGIGKGRKEALLKKYKTTSKIQSASNEELEKILPKKVVTDLKEYLDNLKEGE